MLEFRVQKLRFDFESGGTTTVHFAPGSSANLVRGAFGKALRAVSCDPACASPDRCPSAQPGCAYRRIFKPRLAPGDAPSGFLDPPRPFVIRSRDLDGRLLQPGDRFHLEVHLFDTRNPSADLYRTAFARIAEDGLGSSGSVANLRLAGETAGPWLTLDLSPVPRPVKRILVEFHTPTELKADSKTIATAAPDFAILFARARDRLSSLSNLYGSGPLDVDFKGMAGRAKSVRLLDAQVQRLNLTRRRASTGASHPVGGFTGQAVYGGAELNEFVPFLEAAGYTGVGRQTVWGKGEIRVSQLE